MKYAKWRKTLTKFNLKLSAMTMRNFFLPINCPLFQIESVGTGTSHSVQSAFGGEERRTVFWLLTDRKKLYRLQDTFDQLCHIQPSILYVIGLFT
jgi:hypothetical protein